MKRGVWYTRSVNPRFQTLLGCGLLLAAATCAPGCVPKVNVEIIETRVAFPKATPEPGSERFLPAEPPRPFTLGGGPARFEGEELRKYLSDKRAVDNDPSGWTEKVKTLVTVDYIDPADQPIAVEIYQLADPMLARMFAKAYLKDGPERKHAVAGAYAIYVLWFIDDDPDLSDAGEWILATLVEAIEKPVSPADSPEAPKPPVQDQ